jgi:hypothetical protein
MRLPKRQRTLQLECLEDRELLSGAKSEPLMGTFQGSFQAVQLSVNPQVYETTTNAQGTTKTFGQLTMVAHDTTTVKHHGKKATVSFTDGTGTMTDVLGDQFFFTFSGKGPLTSSASFTINEVGAITGGTGLAAGAKGRFTGVVTGSFISDTITITVDGKFKP